MMKRYNFCPGNMGSYDILFGKVPGYVQCPKTQQGETLAVSPDTKEQGGWLLVWLSKGGSGGGAFRFDGGGTCAGYLMEKTGIKLTGDANALLGFLRTQGFDVHIDDPTWNSDGLYRPGSAANYPKATDLIKI